MRKLALAALAVSAVSAISSTQASATYYGYGHRHYAPRVVCSLVPVTVYGYYGYHTTYKRVCRTVY